MAVTYLDRILEFHRGRAAADERSEAWLHEAIASNMATDPAESGPRGFAEALRGPGLSVISEIKRRSPSRGDLHADLDPESLALTYQAGGAAALSVLTDSEFFGGSTMDLVQARSAVRLPVIRKDFTIDRRDLLDARLMGADCVLLIVAALSEDELADFTQLAGELGLDALVETHDETEVEQAVAVGATLVGVNQRDLVTFEVDTNRAVRVRQSIPSHVLAVAESGVRGPQDAARLYEAGYDAILVGESLVTNGDPAAAVSALLEVGSEPR